MFRTVGERVTVKPSRRRTGKRSRRLNGDLADRLKRVFPDKTRSQSRSKSRQRVVQLRIDVLLLLAVITLVIFGLVMVFSASYDYSLLYYGDSARIFTRQLIWLALGGVIATVLAFMDYHRWRQLAVPAMAVTIFLLLGVLVVNEARNGAVRTLFEGSIQPSELAKLVTIIYLAVWLFAKREKLGDVGFGLIPLAAIIGILGGLIIIQPDLSAVVTIFVMGGLMFFLAGGEIRQIGILLLVAVVVGWIVVLANPTGSERIQYYIAGLKDPTQGSYHVRRALESFVKGGWVGVGIGKAETKLTGLPVPPTDSIFAVVGEETGVFGAAALVALFVLFLWRGMTIARRAPDELGSLLAGGLTIWLAMEAFINMAVMVNLVPFAGNALPFISAGGSSLIVSLAAVGILLNISRLSHQRKEEEGKSFDAVVNLRRRDRRRSIPSARRSTSTDR